MLRTLLPLAALAALTGCPVEKDDTSGDDTNETGETGETGDTNETGDTAGTCDAVNSGTDWAWEGACPQMYTPCDIVVTECSLAIDYEADGGMTMGMPFAGTISGNTITFEDGDLVTGCVGTIEDADHISGTCDGPCEFTLTRG